MPLRPHARRLGVVICAMLLGACGSEAGAGPTRGDGKASLTITGADQTDTVTAFLPRPLVIEVRDQNGRAAAGIDVAVTALVNRDGGQGILFLDQNDEAQFTGGGGMTDGFGRVTVRIRFGGVAGPTAATIEAPALALSDTAHFTVLAGQPAGIATLSMDTALQVGRTTVLPATGVIDRYRNPRTDPVSYQALTQSIGLTGSTVTALAIDRCNILVQAGTWRDTVRISVVPVARFAAGGAGLWFFDSDLSGYHRSPTGSGFVAWTSNGAEAMADGVNVSGSWTGDLVAVTPEGASRPVLTVPPGLLSAWIPRAGPGGTLYFTGISGTSLNPHFQLWRGHQDGSVLEPVPGIAEAETTMPAPSPDGRRLAYVTLIGSGRIRVFDLEHGVPLPVDVPGHSPRWSPSGGLIAYVDPDAQSALKVMAPDGTGRRTIGAPATRYDIGLDWSPDGQWVLAKDVTRQRLELVNPTSGLILPLPRVLDDLQSPAWRP